MKHRATFLCTPEAVSYLCGRFGFGISDVQAILLAEYLELLMKWNDESCRHAFMGSLPRVAHI